MKIYADFNNADPLGRLRLNCVGTREDLTKHGIELREGLELTFYTDDGDENGQLDELLAKGIVTYSREERIWVATIDWKTIHHASEREASATES